MNNFSRSEAKRALGRIIDAAENGVRSHVMNGLKKARPGSSFIPLTDLDPTLRAVAREVDAERLRRQWSDHREEVENIGTVLIVMREGEAACAFVPAPDALRRKVSRNQTAMKAFPLLSVDEIAQAIRTLRDDVDDVRGALVGLVGDDSVPTLLASVKRLETLVNVLRNEWRESRGLPPMAA